jgi:hypothetical protein
LSAIDDPTLRAGDLVVTDSGVNVFRGGSQLPHKDRDFVDYRGAREVAGQHRGQLEAMVRRYYNVHAQAPAAQEKAKKAENPTRRSSRRRSRD